HRKMKTQRDIPPLPLFAESVPKSWLQRRPDMRGCQRPRRVVLLVAREIDSVLPAVGLCSVDSTRRATSCESLSPYHLSPSHVLRSNRESVGSSPEYLYYSLR